MEQLIHGTAATLKHARMLALNWQCKACAGSHVSGPFKASTWIESSTGSDHLEQSMIAKNSVLDPAQNINSSEPEKWLMKKLAFPWSHPLFSSFFLEAEADQRQSILCELATTTEHQPALRFLPGFGIRASALPTVPVRPGRILVRHKMQAQENTFSMPRAKYQFGRWRM